MTNIIIPMAGLGTRFSDAGFDKPKPLIEIDGKTLIQHSVETLGISGQYIFITREYENKDYNKQITEILNDISPGHIEIRVSGKQHGTSYSALFAKDYIDNDDELVLTNCDQRLEWDPEDFLRFSRSHGLDGSILTHESSSHKHSYAVVSNGFVTHLAEKNPISNNALVGLHYWKHGKDFVRSAEDLVKSCKADGREAYVSLTYNNLIAEGKKIVAYQIPSNGYIPLGTPRDLEIYQAKINEYYEEKPKTIFLDLDGTALRHAHHFPSYEESKPELLPGVLNKVNEWITAGHKIVITTARREVNRSTVEAQLKELGLHWDYMIMDVSKGQRIIINDKLQTADPDRAIGINIITDSGFATINWKDYGL